MRATVASSGLSQCMRGELVYEPFSGSGSQLIAAAKLSRRCYAMELAPEFVDVARIRWTTPPKPGMLRVDDGAGTPIKLELWALSAASFGKFVAAIPPPLSIGTIRLADGRGVKGFIVEPAAIDGARDISAFGGWRAFMAQKKARMANGE